MVASPKSKKYDRTVPPKKPLVCLHLATSSLGPSISLATPPGSTFPCGFGSAETQGLSAAVEKLWSQRVRSISFQKSSRLAPCALSATLSPTTKVFLEPAALPVCQSQSSSENYAAMLLFKALLVFTKN